MRPEDADDWLYSQMVDLILHVRHIERWLITGLLASVLLLAALSLFGTTVTRNIHDDLERARDRIETGLRTASEHRRLLLLVEEEQELCRRRMDLLVDRLDAVQAREPRR